jgi:hypothetical protein
MEGIACASTLVVPPTSHAFRGAVTPQKASVAGCNFSDSAGIDRAIGKNHPCARESPLLYSKLKPLRSKHKHTHETIGTGSANALLPMQTAYPEQISPATLFSRERRRQRMLEFLQAFEQRSWRCAPESPFLVPLPKEDLREPLASSDEKPR